MHPVWQHRLLENCSKMALSSAIPVAYRDMLLAHIVMQCKSRMLLWLSSEDLYPSAEGKIPAATYGNYMSCCITCTSPWSNDLHAAVLLFINWSHGSQNAATHLTSVQMGPLISLTLLQPVRWNGQHFCKLTNCISGVLCLLTSKLQ